MKAPHYSYQILIILLIVIAYNTCHKKEPVDWTPPPKISTPMPDYPTKFPPDPKPNKNQQTHNPPTCQTKEYEELTIREKIIVDKDGVVHRIKYIEP